MIMPDLTYSVSEAARYLGIHRCTIYGYVCHPQRPFIRHLLNNRMLFCGNDLIAYKAAGLPKERTEAESFLKTFIIQETTFPEGISVNKPATFYLRILIQPHLTDIQKTRLNVISYRF